MSLSPPAANGVIPTTTGNIRINLSGHLLTHTACHTSMASRLSRQHNLPCTTERAHLHAALLMLELALPSLHNTVPITALRLAVMLGLLLSQWRVWFLDSQ